MIFIIYILYVVVCYVCFLNCTSLNEWFTIFYGEGGGFGTWEAPGVRDKTWWRSPG